MSVIDDIEEIESGLREQRYPDEVVSTARQVQDLFPRMNDALEYASAYRETYRGEAMDDPVGFAENWHDTFGDMSGIVDELSYQD